MPGVSPALRVTAGRRYVHPFCSFSDAALLHGNCRHNSRLRSEIGKDFFMLSATGPVGRDGEDQQGILTMLQPIRIPVSIFIALIPSIAASQITVMNANLRDTQRGTGHSGAQRNGPAHTAHRDAKTNRESSADKRQAKKRIVGMKQGLTSRQPSKQPCETSIRFAA